MKSIAAAKLVIALASNFSSVSNNTLNPYDNSFENGVRLALQEVHFSAPIELEKYDTSGDVRKTLATGRAIANGKSAVAIGFHSSAEALLDAPILVARKMAMISTSASANRFFRSGRTNYSMTYSNASQAKALAELALKKFNPHRVEIVSVSDCAYCMDLGDSLNENFTGIKNIVLNRDSVLESSDLQSLALKIAVTKPDAIFIPDYEVFSARMIRALLDAGYHGPFFGGDGWANANGAALLAIPSTLSFQNFFIGIWDDKTDSAVTRQFCERYKKRYKRAPDTDAALGYDSVRFLLQALENTTQFNRSSINAALEKIQAFQGVTGKITFERDPKETRIIKIVPLFKVDLKAKRFQTVGSETLISIKSVKSPNETTIH